MARVKGGTIHKERRKKVLKQAEGYFGSKHRLYKSAKEQLMHSLRYAFRDRRRKKRDFRKLWITRINAACRLNDISYSKFIDGLTKANIEVNRKMISEIAINNPDMFKELVKIAKEGKVTNTTVKLATAKSDEVKETKKVAAPKKATTKTTAAKKETVKKTASKTTKTAKKTK